jgi:hypothetical protein
MITLRGKLTRTLVEAKPVTPAITRSNLPASEPDAADIVASPAITGDTPELVEEWIWRGVWAFGSLPEEEVDVLSGVKPAAASTAQEAEGDAKESSWIEKLTSRITNVAKSAEDSKPIENEVTNPVGEESEEAIEKEASTEGEAKPRPFCYRFIKNVDAIDVVVPSSLLVVQEEEEVKIASGEEVKVHVATEEEKVKDVVDTSVDSTTLNEDTKMNSETMKESDNSEKKSGDEDAGEIQQSSTVQAIDEAKKEVMADALAKDSSSVQAPNGVQNTTTKPTDKDVVMLSPSQTQESETNAPTTAAPAATADKPTASPTLKLSKQTYGDEPYTPANLSHPTPPGGKWEGHFENIVPNNTNPSKKRKDKRDNRIRELFYLFFNSSPPPNAMTAFVDDSTDAVDKVESGEGGEYNEKLALPEGRIHVRGYGTNRFGTFEIVGSLDLESGMLHCQRCV